MSRPPVMTAAGPLFLDQRLDDLSHAEVISHLYQMNRAGTYTYLVTPNIHHLLRLLNTQAGDMKGDYGGADLVICDSRVVEMLASFVGKRITAYPGADIVKDLLASKPERRYLVGVVGPAAEQVASLSAQYPAWRFAHYATPMMQVGTPDFDAAVDQVLAGEWDFLLLCLGFPKQEAFAAALRQRGRSSGTALCVGASVDFLVGTQRRAPRFVQRARLEWLHRLLQDPKRLWRRYLIEGPGIFYWYLKLEVMNRTRPTGPQQRSLG